MSTKDRLVEEAARLFSERGYHGTSMGDLANALGIQKSSLYTHVAAKEDLLATLALSGATTFHAALDGIEEDLDPLERLRLAFRAHLRIVERQLDVATVWLQEWRYLTGEAREQFVAERRRYERRFRQLFQDAVDAGALRADLNVREATTLLASVANWAYTWFTHETDVDEVCDHFWKLITEGMLPPASASRTTVRRSAPSRKPRRTTA